jgi:hypothetical protein
MATCKCCIDCINRKIGCHSKCEQYKIFRLEQDKRLEESYKKTLGTKITHKPIFTQNATSTHFR